MKLPIAIATAIFFCCGVSRGTTTSNTTSESAAQIDTIVNTTATQTVDQYSTQLIAQLQGGSTLYDQTFNSAFSSPTVQAAVSAAENVLKGAGATSFRGPALESYNQTLLNSTTNTVQTGSHLDNTVITVKTYFGPKTIYPGDYGICQNYTPGNYPPVSGCTLSPAAFDIPPGGEDIDTFIFSFYTISEKTTTTDTYEITQVYDLVGKTGATSSVPEPGSWALALADLMALGCVWMIRRLRPTL